VNYQAWPHMMRDWAGNPEVEEGLTDISDPICGDGEPSGAGHLLRGAARTLESIEALLLNPTPQHIQQAEQLLERAAEDIQAAQAESRDASTQTDGLCHDALTLQTISRRVHVLLNGALRVQWHQLRRMGPYLETYTAVGGSKVCVHHLPRLDLKL
jgi:hypothetical protein